MPILAILGPVVSWIFRTIVIKFVVLTAVFAVLTFLIPKLTTLINPYLSTGSLSSAFGSVSPTVWYFLDMFSIGYGVPLLIAAYVTRFLIRRLPVIG